MKIKKIIKEAQGFGGYYTGNIPEYGAQFLGTSAVDASQINSLFGKSSEAINLVNQFDSSLLLNISFIFNFAKSGAYGVYLSELDRAIKTKALQKKLEQMGYVVKPSDQGILKAYAPENAPRKNQEDIQKDIDKVYQDLESKGGSAIGINMNSILDASKKDASVSNSKDPSIWEWIAILHIGGTIVHEATHARGATDEASPEAQEAAFITWALPRVNLKYKDYLEGKGQGDTYNPLSMTSQKRHANRNTWYKKAQWNYYPREIYNSSPTGSDISGRHPDHYPQDVDSGRAAWGLEMMQRENVPIERRLSKEFMSPLPQNLSQEHDILEEQLRKYTQGDKKIDPELIIEELLSEGHTEPQAYTSIETLLENKRPKPLLLPLKKASRMNKTATLFGWMNNLEISDGSTIPGLGDRVMAWDDRDECFSEEETWIRKQVRYNPTYDIKGFYYRWIEPRFQPQLFDDMTRDYSGTHPAKRFASNQSVPSDLVKILSVLGHVKSKVLDRKIKNTRLIISQELLPLINKIFSGNKLIQLNLFDCGNVENDKVSSVWISVPEVMVSDIQKAENYLQGKGAKEDESLIDDLFGSSVQKENAIREIIGVVRDTCKEYGIRDIYLAGGYPRDVAMGRSLVDVEDLDFSCAWPNQSLKVGGLVAEKLNATDIQIFHRTMTLSFTHKNIKVDFKGNYNPVEIREQLRKNKIPTTALNFDIYNRDFTMNMLIYDVMADKIYDISGEAKKDIERKTIRTYFDPNFICKENPLIILRALKFQIRYGFEIEHDLAVAMIKNAPLLFDGRYSEERLLLARESVKREGKKEASELFQEFGLQKIESL